MLSLRLLGELQVARGGVPVDLPPSRKAKALLAFLAATERPQRRERLCELFWDVPDDPRGALRWTLSRLRSALEQNGEGLFVADRQVVAIDVGTVQTDLAAIRENLKGGVDAVSTDTLKNAANAFDGPFLAGLELTQHPEIQSWLAGMRDEMLRLQLAVLTALDDRHLATPAESLPYLRQIVQADPSLEWGWVRLVERLKEAGSWQEAEAQHAAAIEALKEYGGASPALDRALRLPVVAADPQDPRPDPPPAEPDIHQEIRFCRAPDGTRIAYALSGEGPPLVKTANWMNHLEFDWQSPIWGHFLCGLSSEHRLLRYDARGNGLSDWDVGELSVATWLADLETVVDAAGFDRFPLLGVSQGCAISVAYAVKHPERVSHLILYGGFPAGIYARGANARETAQRDAMVTLARLGWGQSNPAFRQMFTSLFIPAGTQEHEDAFNELQRISTSPEGAARYLEADAWLDVRDLLERVTTPTLVLHPVGDAVIAVELGRELAAGIPGARFTSLPGKNHLFLRGDETETRFFEEFRRFLAS
jgi:DNA-binding SARP family transcriptional activator/pimeloyl-ACP methyl ester carboxylesterase